jgi:hypothetical protein
MFTFFLKSYRSGILEFCGSSIQVKFNQDGDDCKFCFRKFENGQVKLEQLESRHSNVLKGVVAGKKSWGLWVEQWTSGINEWCFTREEILGEFEKRDIKIPESLMKEFDNLVEKKRIKRLKNVL